MHFTHSLTHSLSVTRLLTRSLAHSLAQVDVTADSVLLSGVRGRRSKQEMFFKSYGNVPEGNAVVMEIPFSALGSAPTAASATWEERWNGNTFEFITAKAARPGPDGGVLVLLWGEEASGSLQLFDAQRRSVWGPTKYGETHGEATDVAVSRDGGSAAISGHGGDGEALFGKMTSVRLADGTLEWSKEFAICDPAAYPTCKAIFNECWGVQPAADGDGFVMACGAGIENCDLLTGENLRQCQRDRPVAADPRPGAQPRPPAVWMSLIVRAAANGQLRWQRIEQWRESGAPRVGQPGWEPHSSASEFAIAMRDGKYAFVQDEVIGVGLMLYDSGA